MAKSEAINVELTGPNEKSINAIFCHLPPSFILKLKIKPIGLYVSDLK